MSKYGDLDFDEGWYDEPLEQYLDYKRSVDEITDERFSAIHRVVVESPTDVEWQAWDEVVNWRNNMTLADIKPFKLQPKDAGLDSRPIEEHLRIVQSPADAEWQAWDEAVNWRDGMTIADARAFKQQLEDAELSSRTLERKLRTVQSFLKELLERDVIESNPVAYVCDETDFDHDERDKIDRTIGDIGEFLRSIPNLQQRAMGVTFAKTGIRIGENLNIDLPYLHLDHDIYDAVLDQHDVTLVDEIADHPDTLYIPSEPTVGETFRGEKRQVGNKRKRGTKIPVDGELKKALLDWLAVRPETSHPHPLWVSPVGKPDRIGKDSPNEKLTNYWAEETGLVNDGSTGAFYPHWFRTFFTTNMLPGGHHDDAVAPGIVKYIRGDVGTATAGDGKDIMDVYKEDWGDQVRQKYLAAIYHFGIYD